MSEISYIGTEAPRAGRAQFVKEVDGVFSVVADVSVESAQALMKAGDLEADIVNFGDRPPLFRFRGAWVSYAEFVKGVNAQ
jgi:hypothetical protein